MSFGQPTLIKYMYTTDESSRSSKPTTESNEAVSMQPHTTPRPSIETTEDSAGTNFK